MRKYTLTTKNVTNKNKAYTWYVKRNASKPAMLTPFIILCTLTIQPYLRMLGHS